jgi:AcrR family transcriptional regulator
VIAAMGSKIQSRILDSAIDLFADYGYFGVTTRDLAQKAKVTEGSIYRLFASKKDLFEAALKVAISRSIDPAQFLLMIFEQQGKQDFSTVAAAVVGRWYASLPQSSARLLTQAYFTDEKWAKEAYEPIDKIIEILTTVMERERGRTRKFNPALAARALIMALLHFKITYASRYSGQQETAAVEAIIQQWLLGME